MADTNLDMDQERTYTINLSGFCDYKGGIIDITANSKDDLIAQVVDALEESGMAHAAIWHYPHVKFDTDDRICIGCVNTSINLDNTFWDANLNKEYILNEDCTINTPSYLYDEEIDGCECHFFDMGVSLENGNVTISSVGRSCVGYLCVSPERARQLAELILDVLDGGKQ